MRNLALVLYRADEVDKDKESAKKSSEIFATLKISRFLHVLGASRDSK